MAECPWYVSAHVVRQYLEIIDRPESDFGPARDELLEMCARTWERYSAGTISPQIARAGGAYVYRGPKPRRLRFVVSMSRAEGAKPQVVDVLPAFDGQVSRRSPPATTPCADMKACLEAERQRVPGHDTSACMRARNRAGAGKRPAPGKVRLQVVATLAEKSELASAAARDGYADDVSAWIRETALERARGALVVPRATGELVRAEATRRGVDPEGLIALLVGAGLARI